MLEIPQLSEAKRRLLERYLRGDLVQNEDGHAITRRPPEELAPLSLAQERLWLRAKTAGIPLLYNESITVRRRGPLDAGVLEQSLTEIIRRHEIWRTTYDTYDGQPY